ncbi:AAA family ATPase [Clostridium botulinum]|uniref:Nuclease SbcCD subunit C n=1 Tax=Clostridium botulinum TaxID=1491 RepID=A0A6B4JHI5_CLOBO|nr:AAA family ATPase [Clostridium botulinum]EES48618.1 ATPase involved in DNA repair [Clostridium botulinum E1 str. 'BoNT E Beluga']MBY6759694.1 AAA family ATPase [Clostridium botulinum]MBY6918602.1 AAA family ATPase [Clostridium botulinum]MCR1129685.1 AAA family ATPase [Clostridium botulinum]NFJ56418.1 DNA repair protein [Clostridium botulinum]
MQLEITNIAITGFKGYKDKQEYILGHRTVVAGDNGLGKSSIGEAIVWALTGCDIWGNEKAATRLVNDKRPKVTEIVLDFLLDGEPQTIIRRKKGSGNEVYWNDAKSSTNDIAREIFKNKNVFLSIVNPYYFPDLAPKDAKQLLSDVLKPISRDEIFIELGEYLKKVLLNNGFRIPETFMHDTRSDIKEHEENIIYLEGVQDGLKPMEALEKKVFDDCKLKSLKNELDELKQADTIEIELSKLQKPRDSTVELNELRVQEATIKATLNNIALQSLLPIEVKKARKDELLADYKTKKNKIGNMESKIIKCDGCGNEIDLTKEAKEILEADIKEVCAAGVKLKDEITEIEAKNIEITENNEKIKLLKENEVNEGLHEIERKRQSILLKDEESKKEYEEKRQAIIDNNVVKQAENEEKIQILRMKISALENEERKIINFNASADAAISHNEKLVKERELNEGQIQNSKNKIEQLKLALDACKQYNSIKLKNQSEQIKPYLDKVDISFEKLTKDGEIKDDFKINYEGKEFNKLSNAEKIKAGLEIANLLINIQNLHFPIFIDNAESINEVLEIDTQMIKAVVTTDKAIKIEVIE